MAGTNGRVADAAHDCIVSFDAIARIHTYESESSTAASGHPRNEDGRSRFQIWMSNLGAAHPATDRKSADYRLRDAPEVVDRIVELLGELAEINGEALEIISGERPNREVAEVESNTESSSPSSGQDELSELFLSIGDVLTSLFKVSMLVKKATTRDRYARAASAKDNPYLAEFDMRHVADKYPKVREQPWLLERLGTAITRRRQFLRYCRNHKNRIAHVSSSNDVASGQNEDALRPLYHDGKLEIPADNTYAASSTKTPMTRPTLSPTTASTLQPDKIVREDLQDLDDRDDAVSQSTSVAYSQANEEGSGHLRVVRLHDLSHDNEPFECPYCFSIVQARRQRSWRKHVLSDLRAYVCVFEDCDAGLFEDKNAWAQHDAEEHRRQWDCQQCRDTCGPFSSPRSLHEHMCAVHAGHELPTEVLTQVVKASSRPLTEITPDCPLCDFDTEVHHHADRVGQAIPSGSQAVIPLAELQKHLALHQEQLALFAIPPAIERSVESESRHGKSQVDPGEQVRMMANWQDYLPESKDADTLEQRPRDVPNIDFAEGYNEGSPSSLTGVDFSESTRKDSPGHDATLYKPQEGDFPSVLPGDIVYISRQTGEERLLYKKAVYLGKSKSGQHTAVEWDTKDEVEVSLPELVRKTTVTQEEKAEAELLRTISTPRYYLKHATIPPEVIFSFVMKAGRIVAGQEWLDGYDRALVQTTFSAFRQECDFGTLEHSVRVEDIVRMFYFSALSHPGKNTMSNDNAWKAVVERRAALLTDVLIGIIDQASDQLFPERDNVSGRLREEQASMMSRAKRAIRHAKGQSSSTSGEHADSPHEDLFNEAELSPQLVEALKSRLITVISGEETSVTLPKFGAHLMTQACSSFLVDLNVSFLPGQAIRLKNILDVFRGVAAAIIRQDRSTSANESRSVPAEKLVALFLSLLISVDANLELERLNGFPPRIRNRFTAVLMEERSRTLSQVSEIEEQLFRVSQRSKPEFGIHFFSEESRRAHDKIYGEMMKDGDNEHSDPDDPSENKYCYCLRGSHGDMVACDGPSCRRKWFHLSCTDLQKPLDDCKTWFCIFCQPPRKDAAEETRDSDADDIADKGDAVPEPEPKNTQEAEVRAKERPPRGMVCDNCKFVWRSALALELRDCPNCGSYSVFAESPPRATSPEITDAALRPDATGEEVMGQYFSERTNKFMSLYRRESLAESKSKLPREDFPDPWSHLHAPSSANSPGLDEKTPATSSAVPPDISGPESSRGDGVPATNTRSSKPMLPFF